MAQICETCKHKKEPCYCAPNSTCEAYEPEEEHKKMICYNCTKANSCPTFRTLYSMSKDFCINDCRDYDAANAYRYRKIAENDDLMALIFDYFMDNIQDHSRDEAKQAIINTLMTM